MSVCACLVSFLVTVWDTEYTSSGLLGATLWTLWELPGIQAAASSRMGGKSSNAKGGVLALELRLWKCGCGSREARGPGWGREPLEFGVWRSTDHPLIYSRPRPRRLECDSNRDRAEDMDTGQGSRLTRTRNQSNTNRSANQ